MVQLRKYGVMIYFRDSLYNFFLASAYGPMKNQKMQMLVLLSVEGVVIHSGLRVHQECQLY